MTTTTLTPATTSATTPAPAALALAPFLAVAGVLIRALRYLILIPALLVAAVRHQRRAMDPASVWQADDALFTQDGTLDLSVVIPFYNPGDALRPTVQRLVDIAEEAGLAYEVIAVSDGSTDGSEASIEGLAPTVRVVVSPTNLGKGAALHRGFALAHGRYVGFVDADGDIDPRHVVDYFHAAQAGGHDVVYASKRHAESLSASSSIRKVISYGFIALVGSLFALGINDTQTGCKLFRRQTLADVLPRLREQRFAFDLEFFVAARAAGIDRMAAAPVEIEARMAGSSVGRAAITRTLADALTVLGRLHFSPTYRNPVNLTTSAHPAHSVVVPMPRSEAQLPLAASVAASVPSLKAA
jgi:cellulose synthase/poly-beta-1,6-N-acetylglucosamine synthase-like glycosyltransferase